MDTSYFDKLFEGLDPNGTDLPATDEIERERDSLPEENTGESKDPYLDNEEYYALLVAPLTDNEKAIFDFIFKAVKKNGNPILISADVMTRMLNADGVGISRTTVARLLKKLEYTKCIYVAITKSYGYIYSVKPIEYIDGMDVSLYG